MAEIVKVLIVTDSSGGYRETASVGNTTVDFHLGEFVKVLQTTTWQGFTLQITKAHRENVTLANNGADINNFRFDTHDLSQYDEILLFAIRRDGDSLSTSPVRSSNISDAEVKAIADFMDAGGGVFATGDHENLGAGVCARLPRVRNMRRWYWDAPGPNGEPIAPRGTPGIATPPGHTDAELVDRHDTLRAGHDYDATHPNDHYQFDDQSDNIAQEIQPVIFETKGSRYFKKRWPHPLLCSPEGMVRYLPDHAHEGQCEVPANLGLNVTVTGYNKAEYPTLSDGTVLSPVVVAHATVIGGHATFDPYKPVVNPKTFGVIGAYDGQRVVRNSKRLGRVVVDATWHHFFNINLSGSISSGDPAKRQGFYAPLDPGQADHYKMIKHYYRNIIYWLIPYGRRIFTLHHITHQLINRGQFYELNPLTNLRDFKLVDINQLIALAGLADAYFRNAYGACWGLQFLPIIWQEYQPIPRIWERFEPILHPWATEPIKSLPEEIGTQFQLLNDVALGSAVLAAYRGQIELGEPGTQKETETLNKKSLALFQKHLKETMQHSLTLVDKHLQQQMRVYGELSELARASVKSTSA